MAYQEFQLSDLRTRLLDKVENSSFYATAELDLALNESLRLWNLFTGTWRRSVTVTIYSASGDNYFALPQTMTFATTMQHSNVPLSKDSIYGLDMGRPGWEEDTVATAGVPTAPAVWAPVSLTLCVYWPKITTTSETLTVKGVSATPVLTNAGDYVDLNKSRLNTLLDYAKHYLNVKRGATEMQKTLPARQKFIEAAADENALFRESSFYRWAQLRNDKLQLTPMHAPQKH